MIRPILDELPEGFRVFFVLGAGVGADEGVGEGEAVRLPDEFDVHVSLRGALGFCRSNLPIIGDCFGGKSKSPPRNDIIIGDLRPV